MYRYQEDKVANVLYIYKTIYSILMYRIYLILYTYVLPTSCNSLNQLERLTSHIAYLMGL